jgi:hypothetical protein
MRAVPCLKPEPAAVMYGKNHPRAIGGLLSLLALSADLNLKIFSQRYPANRQVCAMKIPMAKDSSPAIGLG